AGLGRPGRGAYDNSAAPRGGSAPPARPATPDRRSAMGSRLMVRLAAPLLFISLLLLASALATAWYVQSLQHSVSEILEVNVASMRYAEEREMAPRETHGQPARSLLPGAARCLEAIPRLRLNTDHWLAEAERVATTEREQFLMASARRGYEHF